MTREIFFFNTHAKIQAARLFPELFLFYRKALNEVKVSGLQP